MKDIFMPALSEVYNKLADRQSKEIFINRLNFLVTGDYEYMHNIIHKYVPDLARLNDEEIPSLLEKLPADRDIVLYGAGEDARANLRYFRGDRRLRCFCDRDPAKQEKGVDGYEVISPAKLLEDKECSIVISTHFGYEEIRKFLLENGTDPNRIYKMSPYMFVSQDQQYFNPDFMCYEEEEVFVDAGSCNLGTAMKLRENCPALRRVYAFEPDPASYKLCKENISLFPEGTVKLFEGGVWSSSGYLSFSSAANGCSQVSESGEGTVRVYVIDEVIDPCDRVTFIKMDIEGSELEALKGAEKTILRDTPKLAVCIYHEPEDIYQIPKYIMSLNPDYELYIRHHSNGEGETVLYAMPQKNMR